MANKPLSLPKSKRLIKRSDFARVREDGRRLRGNLLALGWVDAADTSGFRAGFVTPRKVGGAVVRNRVRRRLREIVRRNQALVREGIWLVLIATPSSAAATSAELEGEWLRLARRASILAP